MTARAITRLRLGVSQCLLGAKVRYDGDHQWNHFVAARLAPMVEWVGVCPEHDSGMSVPRPPIELRGSREQLRVVEVESGIDHTESLGGWSAQRASQLSAEGLDGFVLKGGSPSCGLRDVPIHGHETETEMATTDGVFAQALRNADPALPTCREDDLDNEERRRAFFLQAVSRAHARALQTRSGEDSSPDSEEALRFFRRHRLALDAREIDPGETEASFQNCDDLRAACRSLALALQTPETLAGKLRALEQVVERLQGIDQRHWLAFLPMLDQVRDGAMQPQVLRTTLHLVAQTLVSRSLLQEFYLHPWLGQAQEQSRQGCA